MYGARVHKLQQLDELPSAGAMMGLTRNDAVLEAIRQETGAGVVFGREGDPCTDGYKIMRDLVHNTFDVVDREVVSLRNMVLHPNTFRVIECVEDLYDVPECMIEPIITMPSLSSLLKEGRISGYGIDPKNLPDEDVYGRLINNGRVETDEKSKMPDHILWHWRTDDPQHTPEELEIIEQTRGWIDDFLTAQMGPEGGWTDPTDPSNTISRRKKETDEE